MLKSDEREECERRKPQTSSQTIVTMSRAFAIQRIPLVGPVNVSSLIRAEEDVFHTVINVACIHPSTCQH